MDARLSWRDHYSHISLRSYRQLGMIRRTFGDHPSLHTRKLLYLSLVRSHLLYCSPLWRPHLISDIVLLEKIQRRATSFILNYSKVDYKSRLIQLKLLPLMMVYELNDIVFFIKSLKNPSTAFNIYKYVSFSSLSTRSSSTGKLTHSFSLTNKSRHFYFNRIPRLWNRLPEVDLSLSMDTIKHKLHKLFWNHFLANFDPDRPCSFHYLCPCSKCI